MEATDIIIKSHKQLVEYVAGKRVLHLNSMGKDSIATLEWLYHYAHTAHLVSVNFDFLAKHPDDDRYWNYLKRRYPMAHFIRAPSAPELNKIVAGMYQSPLEVMQEFNTWEYTEFYFDEHAKAIAKEHNCDFISYGHSRYESVARATAFHRKGILQGSRIYPIGMMGKAAILDILRASNTKLHPIYKVSQSTLDRPSYYRMRSTFITRPEYWSTMLRTYPLLQLDKYRWEEML